MSVQKPLDMQKVKFKNNLSNGTGTYTKKVKNDRDIPRQAYKI